MDIAACCVEMANVSSNQAFINVNASAAISRKSDVAFAVVRTIGITAGCTIVAFMCST